MIMKTLELKTHFHFLTEYEMIDTNGGEIALSGADARSVASGMARTAKLFHCIIDFLEGVKDGILGK